MAKTIAFDLRALQIGHENRGIGMVAKSILTHLEDDVNSYLFYIFDSSNPIEDLGIDLKIKKYSFVETPKLKTTVDTPSDLIDSFRLSHPHFAPLRRNKPDIFLQFDFALGLPKWRKTKNLCIGYDLIPLIMKNQYLPSPKMVWNQPGGRKARLKGMLRAYYYRLKAHRSYSNYRRADKILCISDATKQSFIGILRINQKRLVTIPLAPVMPKKSKSQKNDFEKPYIFYIGGTDNRKHVADTVRAFNIAKGRGQDIALVLAGNEFNKVHNIPDPQAQKEIVDSPYRDDIHLVGFVSDEEKTALYEHAQAFVFCSTYEGFGLPVLEAQAIGCPVICYDNSSIPEVSSKSVFLVKNGDVVSIANAIKKLGNSDRKKLTRDGIEFAKKFTWDRYVKELSLYL